MSLKKSGSIRKAVKSKLSKTRYNSMDLIKPKSIPKSPLESGSVSDAMEDKSPISQPPKLPASTYSVAECDFELEHKFVPDKEELVASSSCGQQEALPATMADKTKKRSKLYALL